MPEEADLILTNARVFTALEDLSEATSVAVRGDRILRTGGEEEVLACRTRDTRVIDLGGRSVIPGVIESHNHMRHGVMQDMIDCSPRAVESIEDIKARIAQRASEVADGEWIVARGYDHTKLADERHPTRWDLDEAAPNNPTLLIRTCAHISVASSRAIEAVGVTDSDSDPQGGSMDRYQGLLTGVMREMAQQPFQEVALEVSRDHWRRGHPITAQYYHRFGITSSHDLTGDDPNMISTMIQASREGDLPLRVYFCVRERGYVQVGAHAMQAGLITGLGDNWIRLGPYKITMDGSGGGATAAMREPYVNARHRGIAYLEQDELDQLVASVHASGYQLAVHALGDRAIEMTLNAVERALTQHPRLNHRHRIEHCGIMDSTLLERMAELEMVAAPQPPFIYYLGDSYVTNMGLDRMRFAYPFRSYIDYGIPACYGSDYPVVDINPLVGIYAAVTRKTERGTELWEDEAVSVHEAIRGYTYWGAYASFEEDIKGTLAPGRLADMCVLSDDLLGANVESIPDMKVDLTILGGRIIYQR